MPRPKMVEERFDKLPKWAQRYIEHIEQDKKTLAHALDAVEESNTEWSILYPETHKLPDTAKVRFHIAKQTHKAWFDVRRTEFETEELLQIHGSDRLLIVPIASNVVLLTICR